MTIKSKMTKTSLKQIEKITKQKLTLGSFICSIRQGEELTQVEFAKKLGISRQHLCDIEHNRKVVSVKLAVKYAGILGYSKEQFIRLCLQDMVDRENLCVDVSIAPKLNHGSDLHDNEFIFAT